VILLLLVLGCEPEKDLRFDSGPSPDTEDVPDTDADADADADTDTPLPDLGEIAQTILGVNAGSMTGFKVRAVPDLNGDGLPEVVLAAQQDSSLEPMGGAVYLLYGTADPEPRTVADAELTLVSEGPFDYLGTGLAICDSNGDGQIELWAGASAHPAGGSGAGAAYGVNLPATGTLPASNTTWKIIGPGSDAALGGSIACPAEGGTVTLGSPYWNTTHEDAGAVWVYHNPPPGSWATDIASAVVLGDATGQHLGTSQALSDFNGDGLFDLAIGGGGEGPAGDGNAVVAVVLGPLAGNTSVADADSRHGEASPADHLGRAMAAGADLDGDGLPDLAVSAYWVSTHTDRGGRVYVLPGTAHGVGGLGDSLAIFDGETQYGYGGISLSWLDDATGDGKPGLLVGEYGAAGPEGSDTERYGAIHLFSEPTGTLLFSQATASLYGETAGTAFGYSSSPAGDTNGDGATDFWVSAYQADESRGETTLFLGGTYR
jgi:hypothetical protein